MVRERAARDGRLFRCEYAQFRYHFDSGARKAGLPEAFTPHQLRHGFATKLLTNSVPIFGVAKYLGHSTTTMTDTYTSSRPVSTVRGQCWIARSARLCKPSDAISARPYGFDTGSLRCASY